MVLLGAWCVRWAGARHPLALQEEVLARVDRSKIFFNTLDQGLTPRQNRQRYGL